MQTNGFRQADWEQRYVNQGPRPSEKGGSPGHYTLGTAITCGKRYYLVNDQGLILVLSHAKRLILISARPKGV